MYGPSSGYYSSKSGPPYYNGAQNQQWGATGSQAHQGAMSGAMPTTAYLHLSQKTTGFTEEKNTATFGYGAPKTASFGSQSQPANLNFAPYASQAMGGAMASQTNQAAGFSTLAKTGKPKENYMDAFGNIITYGKEESAPYFYKPSGSNKSSTYTNNDNDTNDTETASYSPVKKPIWTKSKAPKEKEPFNPNGDKNATQLLMEYGQYCHVPVRIDELSQKGPPNAPTWRLAAVLGTWEFDAIKCRKKKDGRRLAAEQAIKQMTEEGEYPEPSDKILAMQKMTWPKAQPSLKKKKDAEEDKEPKSSQQKQTNEVTDLNLSLTLDELEVAMIKILETCPNGKFLKGSTFWNNVADFLGYFPDLEKLHVKNWNDIFKFMQKSIITDMSGTVIDDNNMFIKLKSSKRIELDTYHPNDDLLVLRLLSVIKYFDGSCSVFKLHDAYYEFYGRYPLVYGVLCRVIKNHYSRDIRFRGRGRQTLTFADECIPEEIPDISELLRARSPETQVSYVINTVLPQTLEVPTGTRVDLAALQRDAVRALSVLKDRMIIQSRFVYHFLKYNESTYGTQFLSQKYGVDLAVTSFDAIYQFMADVITIEEAEAPYVKLLDTQYVELMIEDIFKCNLVEILVYCGGRCKYSVMLDMYRGFYGARPFVKEQCSKLCYEKFEDVMTVSKDKEVFLNYKGIAWHKDERYPENYSGWGKEGHSEATQQRPSGYWRSARDDRERSRDDRERSRERSRRRASERRDRSRDREGDSRRRRSRSREPRRRSTDRQTDSPRYYREKRSRRSPYSRRDEDYEDYGRREKHEDGYLREEDRRERAYSRDSERSSHGLKDKRQTIEQLKEEIAYERMKAEKLKQENLMMKAEREERLREEDAMRIPQNSLQSIQYTYQFEKWA